MNNIILKCLVDTGLSINIMKQNFFNFPTKPSKVKVHTINGTIILNQSVSLHSSKLCPTKQTFYIHNFSEKYDLLLGRNYLESTNTQINYSTQTVNINGYPFKMWYDHIQTDESKATYE